jgi:hypothetical protein
MDSELLPFERPFDLRLVLFLEVLFCEPEVLLAVPDELFLLPLVLLLFLRLREPVEVLREVVLRDEGFRDDPLLPIEFREREEDELLRLLPERELPPRDERLREEPLPFSISL